MGIKSQGGPGGASTPIFNWRFGSTGTDASDPPPIVYPTCSGAHNTPSGASITGLTHLEGKTVKVIIDDAMSADATVSSGAIVVSTLPTSYIEIGLNYTPTIKTMPVELKLPSGNTVGQKKRIVEQQLYYTFHKI